MDNIAENIKPTQTMTKGPAREYLERAIKNHEGRIEDARGQSPYSSVEQEIQSHQKVIAELQRELTSFDNGILEIIREHRANNRRKEEDGSYQHLRG